MHFPAPLSTVSTHSAVVTYLYRICRHAN